MCNLFNLYKTRPSPTDTPTQDKEPANAADAAAGAPAPRMCCPMRSEVRERVGYAAVGCGATALVGFFVGSLVVANVPMEPVVRALVIAVPSGAPLTAAAALAFAYYI